MSKTQRGLIGLVLVAALALSAAPAVAAGGQNPPPPGFILHLSKDVTAHIIVDPHGRIGNPIASTQTSTGQQGSMVLSRKHYPDATVLFTAPDLGSSFAGYALGCDTSVSSARFLSTVDGINVNVMENFILRDILIIAFSEIGVDIGGAFTINMQPAITGFISQACAPSVDTAVNNPGVLVMDVTIGFWVAPGTKTPK